MENERNKTAGGLFKSLVEYADMESFEADEADIGDGFDFDVMDMSKSQELCAEDDNYRIVHPTDEMGLVYLSRGTTWLGDGSSTDDIDFDNYRLRDYGKYYVIEDKKKESKRWLFYRGYGDLHSPSGAYQSAASFIAKKCSEPIWRWVIDAKFPYISTNLNKKVGHKLIGEKEVFNYPEDKDLAFNVKRNLNITKVVIAPGTKKIAAGAFSGLDKVTEIDVPDGVTSIGRGAFSGCSSLVRVRLPSSLKKIPVNAFCYCTSLSDIDIPDGVEYIGHWAFYNCGISAIRIPGSVKYIGARCFSQCPLVAVSIPDGTVVIGTAAFEGSSMSYAFIPRSVKCIGAYCFKGQPADLRIECALTQDEITDCIEGNGVAVGSETCVWNKYWLSRDYMWNSGSRDYSFSYFRNVSYGVSEGLTEEIDGELLDTIELAKTVYADDEWEVLQPNDVPSLMALLDGSGINLEEFETYNQWALNKGYGRGKAPIYILRDLKRGESYIYCSTDTLRANERGYLLDFSGNRPTIDGRRSYSQRYAAEELGPFLERLGSEGLIRWAARKWPQGLKDLKSRLDAYDILDKCDSTITMGSDLHKRIGFGAYLNYGSAYEKVRYGIKDIRFPRNIQEIPEEAFYEFRGIESVTIPQSVRTIGNGAFEFCSNLKSVKLPDGLIEIGSYAFNGATSLREIVIPKSVKRIGAYAFRCDESIRILCEAESKPEGWADTWNYGTAPYLGHGDVVWGYTGESVSEDLELDVIDTRIPIPDDLKRQALYILSQGYPSNAVNDTLENEMGKPWWFEVTQNPDYSALAELSFEVRTGNRRWLCGPHTIRKLAELVGSDAEIQWAD